MQEPEVVISSSPEWVAWRNQPQTRLFLLWLAQTAAAHQESWASREYEADDIHVWNRYNAAALGRVSLCREIVDQFMKLGENQNEK